MPGHIKDFLSKAREDLLTAVRLSRQGSYRRRAPSPESLPHYGEAKRQLLLALEIEPAHREALMMMAQVAEGLMDFRSAVSYLDRALQTGEFRTKKLLKKLAHLRDNAEYWDSLSLTPSKLQELGEYLDLMGVSPDSRSLENTRQWLLSNFDGDPEQVIAEFSERGAFSDYHVLANVAYG